MPLKNDVLDVGLSRRCSRPALYI